MPTAAPASPQIFKYDQPTVTMGPYTFDCATLNAYIDRAWSAFGKENVSYLSATWTYGDPSRDVDSSGELKLDCSGFAWWSTYRKRMVGGLWDENPNAGWQKNWVMIDRPIPGCAVRYSAPPGASNGHVGMVVATGGDNFQTLDSSSNKSPPRKGSIRWIKDGVSRWIKNGGPNVRFVVSREALVAVNDVPVKPPLNIYLAAAKHPIAATVIVAGSSLILLTLLGAGGFLWYKRSRAA